MSADPHRCRSQIADDIVLDLFEILRDWSERVLTGDLYPDVQLVDALLVTLEAARSWAQYLRGDFVDWPA